MTEHTSDKPAAAHFAGSTADLPVRPERVQVQPVPPVPQVDRDDPHASTDLSAYRTRLSNHRTGLSEHRTDLSEFRTDLSTGRTEMSKRRTGMSFQRTRMSADRTLMSVIRTSLSLVGFGFTIFQFFSKIVQANTAHLSSSAPRNFGITLVALGIAMLAAGIIYHTIYMLQLRAQRDAMIGRQLVHGETSYPLSYTLLTAVVLLIISLLTIISMAFGIGPFK